MILLSALAASLASGFAQTPTAPAAAAPAPLFAAVFKTGAKWDPAKPPADQAYFAEHSAHLATLRASSRVVLGARYADVGLIVVTAASQAEARQLFEPDPSIAAGTFALEVHRFSVFYPGTVGAPPPK